MTNESISQPKPENHNNEILESMDISYWCEELNLKAEDLREIIRIVGPAVHDVRLYLAKRLLINWPITY